MDGYLRQADEEDMDLIFQWANEPVVRKNSFTIDMITYEEHKEWYKNLLLNRNSKQYIYVDKNQVIGQIRVVADGEQAEISYSVCMEKRCMGYGKVMLELLYKQVKQDFPWVKKLIARVKPDNIASKKVLMDIGYIEKYQVFETELYSNNLEKYEENRVDYCIEYLGGVEKKVLLLTNNINSLALYNWLSKSTNVYLYSEYLQLEQIKEMEPDWIISYNCKY